MSKSSKKVYVEKNQKFYCELCDYSTSRSSNWKKHISTNKHLKKSLKQKTRICEDCGQIFYSRTTLWRHKKKCQNINNGEEEKLLLNHTFQKVAKNSVNFGQKIDKMGRKNFSDFEKNAKKREKTGNFENFQNDTDTQICELKNLMKNLIESQSKLQENMKEYIENPRTINNNNCNNSMTINMFLQNDCKNAMSLEDFMQNLKISWDDFAYTKDNGYVNGISNIFVKQLKDLKPTERPIHCSDTDKMHFYFKEQNKWEKDTQNKKMDESIKTITKKQLIQIKEWEQAHPTYVDDSDLLDEWHSIIMNLMGGKNEEEIEINKKEIKKKIGDIVNIEHLNKDKSKEIV
tara:strand:+ start:727 stop:1764 length:1038 start_codon:yes stop_codon:yes gene_type:complete